MGPPLSTVDGFAYEAAERRLRPGEIVCMVTDGVADAQNPQGERYGSARLQALLTALPDEDRNARAVLEGLAADVQAFASGAEPADDLTVLIVRWLGPERDGQTS